MLEFSKLGRSAAAIGLAILFVSCSINIFAKPLSIDTQKQTVDQIAILFRENYVDPKLGEKAANYVQQQSLLGKYLTITDPQKFADVLTEDLRHINRDKHVRVFADGLQQPGVERATDDTGEREQSPELPDEFGFRETKVLSGNIGYLDLRYFAGYPDAEYTATTALEKLENTDAMIFDMRYNGGGNPFMVRFLCSFFFNKRTHLNSLYWRIDNRTDEFWTLDHIPGKQRPDVPVFILTSKDTFSGAEEFAYNFQTQKRGTIVGEVTGGGANPGGRFPVNNMYSVFVPTGKAINPVTGTNWEGVGVKPDVQTSSANAYDTALKLAREAALDYKNRVLPNRLAKQKHFATEMSKIIELHSNSPKQAFSKARQVVKKALSEGYESQSTINNLGYQLLDEDSNAQAAVFVFTINTEFFPDSASAIDSLADAYSAMGDDRKADQLYQKATQLMDNY